MLCGCMHCNRPPLCLWSMCVCAFKNTARCHKHVITTPTQTHTQIQKRAGFARCIRETGTQFLLWHRGALCGPQSCETLTSAAHRTQTRLDKLYWTCGREITARRMCGKVYGCVCLLHDASDCNFGQSDYSMAWHKCSTLCTHSAHIPHIDGQAYRCVVAPPQLKQRAQRPQRLRRQIKSSLAGG